MTTPDTRLIAIREAIARSRLSRASVAETAGISLSTLEKTLSGRRALTLATLVRLEEALGVSLREGALAGQLKVAASGVAPDSLGSYNRAAVAWLEGPHLTVRPSFSDSKSIYAYRTDITWSADENCLTFREAQRVDQDFTQFGHVAVPHQSGHIYLVTNRHGQHRLVVLSRPTISGEMHGILTTLQAGRGAHLSPVSLPIALRPIKAGEVLDFGRIPPPHPAFTGYAKLVRKTVTELFAQFVTLS